MMDDFSTAKQGYYLETEEDIFYLTKEEIWIGQTATLKMDLIAERRAKLVGDKTPPSFSR